MSIDVSYPLRWRLAHVVFGLLPVGTTLAGFAVAALPWGPTWPACSLLDRWLRRGHAAPAPGLPRRQNQHSPAADIAGRVVIGGAGARHGLDVALPDQPAPAKRLARAWVSGPATCPGTCPGPASTAKAASSTRQRRPLATKGRLSLDASEMSK